MEKISLEEAKERFGANYHEHPEVLSVGYGTAGPSLQTLSQALTVHGLKLVEIDDDSGTSCFETRVAIIDPKQPIWGTLIYWNKLTEEKR